MKKLAALLSFVLAMGTFATFTTPANAFVAPVLTSISGPSGDPVGSVAGGYEVMLAGEDFCDGSVPEVWTVTIGDILLTNYDVGCDVTGTTDALIASVSAQPLADRRIGRQPVVVVTAAGTSSDEVYFSFIPEVDQSYSTSELVELGELFSRSQRKPIIRSLTAPYTVTGTDSLTNQPYTYITNYDYLGGRDCADPDNAEVCGAYTHESDLGEPFHQGAGDTIYVDTLSTQFNVGGQGDSYHAPNDVDTSMGTVNFDTWLDGREVTELYSDLDCSPNDTRTPDVDNFFDSGDGDGGKYTYCSAFGPDLFSEPFVAEAGQSLSFEWAAIGQSDDYAVYAYLVEVDPTTGAIPTTASPSNHELVMYNSGSRNGTTDWQTSTADVTSTGTYRFRFINGTYDGTGGWALGSLFYLNSFFLSGDTNSITFDEIDDVVVDLATVTGSPVVTVSASSIAGGQLTMISLTPSACSVEDESPPNYSIAILQSPATCILQASQGAIDQYAPAASVITAFEIYDTPQTPGAPTLTLVEGLSQSTLGVEFQAGPSGGQEITGYQYSIDGGSWVTISPTPTNSSFVIPGLTALTTYSVQIRAVNASGPGLSSSTVSGTTLAASAPPSNNNNSSQNNNSPEPYNGPEIFSVVPSVVKTEGGETIVVTGRRLGTGVELSIGGIKVSLITPTATGFKFVMPAGTAGLKDMVYTYDSGSRLNYVSAVLAVAPVVPAPVETGSGETPNPAPKPWRAVGVANMFDPGSSVINSRVRAQVEAMVRLYGSIATRVECSGFTMGPTVLKRDAALSKARAVAVCGLIKDLRPRITIVKAIGKQETKLGGAVRRVEALFTKD